MSARGPSRKSDKDLVKSTTQQNGTDTELQQESHRQTRPSATTRSTISSGKSRKTKKSATEPSSLDLSNVVLSRGRPMKPHETEPFLTIDNLPPEKTFISEKSTISGFGTPRNLQNKAPPITPKSPVLNQLQRMSVYMSPYSRETPGAPSPSVVSGKLSPNKVCRSPVPMPAKSDLNSGSRPNTGTQREKTGDPSINQDTGADTVPTKVLKQTTGSDSKRDQNIKENVSRPSTGNRHKFDSRPSSSKSGSRPGTGSRSGRVGSGVRQKGMRSLPSRAGRVTPANTPFQSPNKQLHSPNFHVKSPFKHNVAKPDFVCDGRNTPSMGMKERTALAAYHINKMIAVAGEKDAHKVKGQLKKGKLKPLYPVAVDGPTIDKCRGIISETRSYGSSPSRTLQRHLHLMSTIPNVHEYLYDRPRTVESVHRTSVASSIDDNSDYEDDSKLPDEIIYPAPKTGSILEPRTPENTFVPIPEPEETQKQTADEKSQIVFATEINSNTADNVNISTQLQQALTVNNTELQTDTFDQDNSNTVNSDLKAAEETDDDGNLESSQLRGISSSKSVRFADDKTKNSKEIKQITNSNIVMQQRNQKDFKDGEDNEDNTVAKKNKQNSAGCKSDEIKEFRKIDKDSDDEEEHDNSNEGGNKDISGTRSNNVVQSENIKSESSGTDVSNTNKINNEDNKTAKDAEGLCEALDNSIQSTENMAKIGRRSSASGLKKAHHEQTKPTSKPYSAQKLSSTDRLHKSVKSETCSKFNKSSASKTNTHKLEVSSVIHGNSVQVSVRPESPNRSPSRTSSASRQSHLFSRDWELGFSNIDSWYNNIDCYENGINQYDHLSSRPKVKFLLDNEEPEMETIFVEDEDDIKLKQDTQISFDTLESEIMALRLNIRNDIGRIDHENEDVESIEHDSDSDSNTVIDPEENLDSNVETNLDSVRSDYYDILEKYRQQCMDRSERYGAISALIVTPRETGSLTSPTKHRHPGKESSLWHFDTESLNFDENLRKSQVLSNIVSSDSGHGSVENISEFSQPTNFSTPEVPRLDLGGNTSDLDIETGQSESTIRSEKAEEEEEQVKTNILELMCDQLSPSIAKERKESKENRQEEEEDVTKLKVVATTKSLSKSRRSKLTLSTNKAPYPPLCFTINARPPAGFLYYFAYGPDMNPDRFKNYVMRENVSRYWGLLLGFNLIFNKKGTSEEAGGFSNIEFNPLRSVEGCLYKITSQELQVLDKCIGYPEHYQHLVLPVWMCNSTNPDSLGVAQYCVPALMYIAQNKWTETERTLNCDYSLSQCIKSADLVTKEYKDSLIAMATQKDSQIVECTA